MELAFVIWAVGTLPSFASGIVVFSFVMMLLSFLAYVLGSVVEKAESSQEDKDISAVIKKIASRTLFVIVPTWFVASMIPDKTTSYQMLAAYGVQKVIENPEAQELAGSGVDVLKTLMEKAKKELAESAK